MSVGSGAKDFDRAGYAAHLGRRVEHFDSQSLASGTLLIIADALVKHAHKVLFVRVLNIESKRPLCVSLRAGLLLHSSIQPKQEHFVSGGGFAAALIADRTTDAVRAQCACCKTQHQSQRWQKPRLAESFGTKTAAPHAAAAFA